MPSPTVTLPELAQRLAQRQTEVEELRRLYEERLADLKQRKEALEQELQQVDREIQAETAQETPVEPLQPVSVQAEQQAPAKKSPGKGSSRKAGKSKKKKAARASKVAGKAQESKPNGQPPLRVVLAEILKKSKTPLSGTELAKKALEAGYQTTSKKFVDVVWVMAGKVDNVENVPNQGYRLKKK